MGTLATVFFMAATAVSGWLARAAIDNCDYGAAVFHSLLALLFCTMLIVTAIGDAQQKGGE